MPKSSRSSSLRSTSGSGRSRTPRIWCGSGNVDAVALLLVGAARHLHQDALDAEAHERGLGPARVRVEAVGAVLPAGQAHEVVEDLPLDEARQLLGVEVAAVQEQVLEVAGRFALDGQDAPLLLVGEAVRLPQERQQRVVLRQARRAGRDHAAVQHVDHDVAARPARASGSRSSSACPGAAGSRWRRSRGGFPGGP